MAELIRQKKSEGRTLCYQRHACILYGIISSIVTDSCDSEKVLQQTFDHVFANINSYDAKCGSFLTWTIQIARNISITYLRGGKQIKHPGNDIETNINQAQVKLSLVPAIGVEITEHEVLAMVLQGCRAHEVAAHFNLSVEVVKIKIRKAMLLKANRVSY